MKRIAPLFIPKGTSRFYKTYGTLFNSGGWKCVTKKNYGINRHNLMKK
jgi:hypothetical protein